MYLLFNYITLMIRWQNFNEDFLSLSHKFHKKSNSLKGMFEYAFKGPKSAFNTQKIRLKKIIYV
jgi:hypothetical protein